MPAPRVSDRVAWLRRRIEEIERTGERPAAGPARAAPAAGPAAVDAAQPAGSDRPARAARVAGRWAGEVAGGAVGLDAPRRPPLPTGAAAVDAALGGGLARAALHEVAAVRPGDPAAAIGFALGLAARAAAAGGRVLWIVEAAAGREAGGLYGPGLDGFGLPARRLVVLAVRRPVDALWAMEEGLKTAGLAAVVAELLDGAAADLTASRRLSLAAGAGGGLGLIVAHRGGPGPSAAASRWRAGAAAGPPDRHGGLGPPAVALALTRNRRGPCGAFTIEWDSHAGRFADLAAARPALAGTPDAGGADGRATADRGAALGTGGAHAGGVAAAAGDRPPRPQAA